MVTAGLRTQALTGVGVKVMVGVSVGVFVTVLVAVFVGVQVGRPGGPVKVGLWDAIMVSTAVGGPVRGLTVSEGVVGERPLVHDCRKARFPPIKIRMNHIDIFRIQLIKNLRFI
jgi:hypothetical protein